ncbi:MAG: hypothetical protein LBT21_00845 [Oscillospiraceae bacterium]|jgi:hypothetical protein|nr:hypothetical protein [Oscillospiraceae bacterium]
MGMYEKSRSEIALTKKVDKYIFTLFTKERFIDMKRDWREKELDKARNRIIKQAIDAHNRRQYALTVYALVPLWEGIIKEKVHHVGRIYADQTKKRFTELVKENDLPAMASDFFSSYIMGQCDSEADIIDDIPGRNASMHGWMKCYPSRKTSLNAILFTDFLLRLDAMSEPPQIDNITSVMTPV